MDTPKAEADRVAAYYFWDGEKWVRISYASYYYKRLLGETVKKTFLGQ